MVTPVHDERITAFGMLLEAHAALMSRIGGDCKDDLKVPVNWFEVLLRLARSPGERLRMSELANQVALSASGLTRLIDRVEEAGMVKREACPNDRRGAYAVLTEAGRRVVSRALPTHIESIERHLVRPIGADGVETLVALLRTLRDAACDATESERKGA